MRLDTLLVRGSCVAVTLLAAACDLGYYTVGGSGGSPSDNGATEGGVPESDVIHNGMPESDVIYNGVPESDVPEGGVRVRYVPEGGVPEGDASSPTGCPFPDEVVSGNFCSVEGLRCNGQTRCINCPPLESTLFTQFTTDCECYHGRWDRCGSPHCLSDTSWLYTDSMCTRPTSGDAGIPAVLCGDRACGESEVCVRELTTGGPVPVPDDAGRCPSGTKVFAGHCVSSPTYRCAPWPSACSSGLTCGCAVSLCSGCTTCREASDRQVQCECDAP
jgi:hypothetical protein